MRQILDKVVDVPVLVVVSDTVEVPQLQFVGGRAVLRQGR